MVEAAEAITTKLCAFLGMLSVPWQPCSSDVVVLKALIDQVKTQQATSLGELSS